MARTRRVSMYLCSGKTKCVIACAFPSFFIHRSLFLQFCNLQTKLAKFRRPRIKFPCILHWKSVLGAIMVFAVNRSRSLPGLIYQALRSSICHGNTISLDFHVYILAAWSQFARELGSGASRSLFLKLRSRAMVTYSKQPDWRSIGRKLGSEVLSRWILDCSNLCAEWLCISLWGSTAVLCVCFFRYQHSESHVFAFLHLRAKCNVVLSFSVTRTTKIMCCVVLSVRFRD